MASRSTLYIVNRNVMRLPHSTNAGPLPRFLSVRSLSVHFPTIGGVFKALDRIDMDIKKGEVLGLMGQSGCGKTLTATALTGMVRPPGRVMADAAFLDGSPLPIESPQAMRRYLGRGIFMIRQSTSSALNPTLKIGLQVSEILVHGDGLNWKSARFKAKGCLDQVRLSSRVMDAYPFELSGGMKQRVLIAMALAIRPRVLIADEPTTGLDAVTQGSILDLFGCLGARIADAMLFISHDLRVLMKVSHRISVIHAGRIVETLPAHRLMTEAEHPHTRAILSAFLELDGRAGCRPC